METTKPAKHSPTAPADAGRRALGSISGHGLVARTVKKRRVSTRALARMVRAALFLAPAVVVSLGVIGSAQAGAIESVWIAMARESPEFAEALPARTLSAGTLRERYPFTPETPNRRTRLRYAARRLEDLLPRTERALEGFINRRGMGVLMKIVRQFYPDSESRRSSAGLTLENCLAAEVGAAVNDSGITLDRHAVKVELLTVFLIASEELTRNLPTPEPDSSPTKSAQGFRRASISRPNGPWWR